MLIAQERAADPDDASWCVVNVPVLVRTKGICTSWGVCQFFLVQTGVCQFLRID